MREKIRKFTETIRHLLDGLQQPDNSSEQPNKVGERPDILHGGAQGEGSENHQHLHGEPAGGDETHQGVRG